MPVPVGVALGAVSSIGRLTGGANPNLRRQERVIIDLLYYLGDRAGLQQLLDARNNKGRSWIPSKAREYAQSALGQAVAGNRADLDTVRPLLAEARTFSQYYPPGLLDRAARQVEALNANPNAGTNPPPPPAAAVSPSVFSVLTSAGEAAGAAGAAEIAGRVAAGGAAVAQEQRAAFSRASIFANLTPVQMGLGLVVVVVLGIVLLRAVVKR